MDSLVSNTKLPYFRCRPIASRNASSIFTWTYVREADEETGTIQNAKTAVLFAGILFLLFETCSYIVQHNQASTFECTYQLYEDKPHELDRILF